MPAEPEAAPESLNVQQAYEQIMRKQVAPALRELGFLQASAADDEDPQVRWAARYALRLDLEREPGRPALARWPRAGGISGCRPP